MDGIAANLKPPGAEGRLRKITTTTAMLPTIVKATTIVFRRILRADMRTARMTHELMPGYADSRQLSCS